MNIKNKRLCIRIFSLLAITASIIYANSELKNSKVDYSQMTTTELQIQVEILSTKGTLPVEMGLELMKRWQTETSKVY